MPSRCCVPGCNSNYDSTLKAKQNNRSISVFKFPKNEQRKQAWIKAIPRCKGMEEYQSIGDFEPSSSSVVCQLHFNFNDVIMYDKHLQPDGSTKELLLARPRLKEDAVSSIFPNLPSYLSKPVVKERTDPQSRREAVFKRQDEAVASFLKTDVVNSFNDLAKDFMDKLDLSGWEFKITDNTTSFRIDENLQIQIHVQKEELTPNDLKWIFLYDLKISKWSQLINLLSRYKNSGWPKYTKNLEVLTEDQDKAVEG
ncbi:uncharacterized protein LOC123010130 [Tribolium madens]|uniref:uncharacterized protein LOC123010130 n=1 Tax=Tribolium madens TaxID=41895 RepID=UPI001CF75C65|nr:uncharacterized protein LOC123010130 [Tribolium madens]